MYYKQITLLFSHIFQQSAVYEVQQTLNTLNVVQQEPSATPFLPTEEVHVTSDTNLADEDGNDDDEDSDYLPYAPIESSGDEISSDSNLERDPDTSSHQSDDNEHSNSGLGEQAVNCINKVEHFVVCLFPINEIKFVFCKWCSCDFIKQLNIRFYLIQCILKWNT